LKLAANTLKKIIDDKSNTSSSTCFNIKKKAHEDSDFGEPEEFQTTIPVLNNLQNFSVYLVDKGMRFMFTIHTNHFVQEKALKVHTFIKNDPEHKMGTFGQFIYDFNCIMMLVRF
jgi:hypothetical protein